MYDDLQEILLTEEAIIAKTKELGEAITNDYQGLNPLVICVLKGAVVFMAELVKRIGIPVEMDFMAVSSYGKATQSSGEVRILKDLDQSVEGRHVLIVEDIIDSGLTLSYLREILIHRNAASVRIVSLLDKPERRATQITPDYCGFTIPDHFVVGYGLDYSERYRNLPFIAVLKPEVYNA
jgi:hypoxanthine phosphoribosyltransferase